MSKSPRLMVTCTRCHRLHRMRDFECVHPFCPRCALPRSSMRLRARRTIARGSLR
jgi:hypothetical protein